MKTRLITAAIAVAVFIPILIFSDTWAFPIAMAIASVVGCIEMINCVGQKNNLWLIIPFSIIAAAAPLGIRYFNLYGGDKATSFAEFLKLSVGVALIIIIYVIGVAVFDNKNMPITDAGMVCLGCLYIIASFTSIMYIRDFIELGKYVYIMIFFCAWMTDSFAYFTGRLFGKHKLIPAVSPKKTVEGAIGGVVFGVITIVVFGFVIETFLNPEGVISANYLVLAVSGVFISIVAQVGDLMMSVIKRHYGIKDYGKMFPGHGGILDRFDSIMSVSIVIAVICTYFNLFA